jgi:hypothetical protein
MRKAFGYSFIKQARGQQRWGQQRWDSGLSPFFFT